MDQTLVESQSFEFDTNATALENSYNNTKKVGVVTEPNLRFGRLPAGMKSIKFFNISASRESILLIESEGNISDKLEHGDKFYFKGKKEVQVGFNSTEPGFYSGTINVNTQSPKNRWGQKWLDLKYELYY